MCVCIMTYSVLYHHECSFIVCARVHSSLCTSSVVTNSCPYIKWNSGNVFVRRIWEEFWHDYCVDCCACFSTGHIVACLRTHRSVVVLLRWWETGWCRLYTRRKQLVQDNDSKDKCIGLLEDRACLSFNSTKAVCNVSLLILMDAFVILLEAPMCSTTEGMEWTDVFKLLTLRLSAIVNPALYLLRLSFTILSPPLVQFSISRYYELCWPRMYVFLWLTDGYVRMFSF